MRDIRIIWLVTVLVLLGIGCLAAKAFGFSYKWVFWTVGIIGVVTGLPVLAQLMFTP